MTPPFSVEKPQTRSRLRFLGGRAYFILKRKLTWWLGSARYAMPDSSVRFEHIVFQHQSMLLRPLKDVDMVLQHNKITNLRLSIARLNQVVIRPGETFSIWRLVGSPSASKGYLEGLTLHNGTISRGIGGGLCQLGNLLYWMVLHSPLTITERWRHGYDVFPDVNRTIPFGCGATLSYNYIDLQVRNDTATTYQINLWLDDQYLRGEITCESQPSVRYEILETDHRFELQWWGGYTRHNRIWKKCTNRQTNETTMELVAENNAVMMYNPLLENDNIR
ncbi:MAG: VanW family protein [Ferruginibacter sp.]